MNTDHNHSPLNYLKLKLYVNSINQLLTLDTSQSNPELYTKAEIFPYTV